MDLSRPLLALFLALLPALAVSAGNEKLTPPKPIKREKPVFPPNMRMAGLDGRVLVDFVINTEGKVLDPVVVESNNPWFERPAIESILKWTFHPAEVAGKPVNIRVKQEMIFEAIGLPSKVKLWSVSPLKHPEKQPEIMRWHVAPQPVNTAFPVYPLAALQAGQSGTTEVKFVIGPDGRVAASQLLQADHPEMGQAALAMIDTWVFTPPKKKDGTPCFAALIMKHGFKPNYAGDVPVSDEARQILKLLAKTSGAIVSSRELDQMPKPLSRRPPVYPVKLREAGRAGEAMIEFFIAPNGDAQLPSIISSTEPEFGYAAVQAVATWRFEAPRKAGQPVTVRVRIPIGFTHGASSAGGAGPAPVAPSSS